MSDALKQADVVRFFWVDALRGIAALVIVVFHYHHFYLANADDRPALPDVSTFPYGDMLTPLYSAFAANAVELFWLISGFVFVHVYLHRQTGVWAFSVARFARLYPLHFATLLYVAGLQLISWEAVGHWQVYGNNDVRHFVLQLFMSSNWNSLSRGLSFNGPIWSVSLEIVVYGIFFCAIPFLKKAPLAVSLTLSVLSWSWVALQPIDLPLIRLGVFECAGYFFLGSMLYVLRPHDHLARALGLGAVGACGAVAGAFADIEHVQIAGIAVALVSLAAGLDSIAPENGKRLSPLGDISYSIYLVHVPLQMTVLLIADLYFAGTRAFADSYWTLPIYVAVSVGVALAAHKWLERPLGKISKDLLLRRGRTYQLDVPKRTKPR